MIFLGTDSELSKSTQISSKELKTKKEKGVKSAKDSKSNGEEEDLASRATVSTFVPELNLKKEEYDEVWKNKDESDNPRQIHDKQLIEQDQMADMETELRKVVDEMMVTELEFLQVYIIRFFTVIKILLISMMKMKYGNIKYLTNR